MRFLALAVLLCAPARAQEAPSPWQGEWETVDGGHGLSLLRCDTRGACDVDAFGLDTGYFGGVNCLRHGRSEPSSSEALEVRLKALGKFETDCPLTLRRGQEQGVSFLRLSRPSDGACKMQGCAPLGAGQEQAYNLLTRESVSRKALDAGECHHKLSKAAQVWCSDEELQGLAEGLRHVPSAPMELTHPWLTRTLAKCDSAQDIKGCLKGEYAARLAERQAEAKKFSDEYSAPGDAAQAKALIARLQGVYKKRFENGLVSGETYQSEDVFEFVGVSDSAAYVKARLEFFNGHTCGLAGIVEYKRSGAFVYQDPDSDDLCLLAISLNDKTIHFSDPNGNCHKFCGARGSLDGDMFTLDQRRKIRYMPIILKSTEYKKSLELYRRHHPAAGQ